jgi:hypothetical protein
MIREVQPQRFTASALRNHYAHLVTTTAPLRTYDRRPMSDEEVMEFIQRASARDSSVSHTGLLRRLRSTGQACEQKRFKRLFQEVLQA